MTDQIKSAETKGAGKTILALAGLAVAALMLAGCSAAGVAVGAGAVGATAAQTEKGFRRSVADTEIRLAINDLWFQADEQMFRKVNLQVQEQRVLLSGNVPRPEQRVEAVRLAWQAPGVREVINEIVVNDTSSLGNAARDSWISTQLETTLLFDKQVSSINYSIETVNQAIFIMGVAQSETELDRVVGHAKDISYVRRVVSYVLLKDDPARTS
ncbi:BON domain-containing protein [Pelagibius litoralis]|uniref:BON domain-containing protein n=1 Tax=Pelagibius litoralis TaxID=374515 RepID=A0A967F2V8_9PROT|nr:BON domain-containing protein [Pelagibius litoralis]NIA72004.1 BON domain-containing protein [Pelagibius litoralis]